MHKGSVPIQAVCEYKNTSIVDTMRSICILNMTIKDNWEV